MCTWLSYDGGFSWSDVAEGTWIYEYADWGGIVVMTKHAVNGPADEVRFSLDYGRCWKTVPLETALAVDNIRWGGAPERAGAAGVGDREGEGWGSWLVAGEARGGGGGRKYWDADTVYPKQPVLVAFRLPASLTLTDSPPACSIPSPRIESDGQRAKVLIHGKACRKLDHPKCSYDTGDNRPLVQGLIYALDISTLMGDKLPACAAKDYEQWTLPAEDRTPRCLLGERLAAVGDGRCIGQPAAGKKQRELSGACSRQPGCMVNHKAFGLHNAASLLTHTAWMSTAAR